MTAMSSFCVTFLSLFVYALGIVVPVLESDCVTQVQCQGDKVPKESTIGWIVSGALIFGVILVILAVLCRYGIGCWGGRDATSGVHSNEEHIRADDVQMDPMEGTADAPAPPYGQQYKQPPTYEESEIHGTEAYESSTYEGTSSIGSRSRSPSIAYPSAAHLRG